MKHIRNEFYSIYDSVSPFQFLLQICNQFDLWIFPLLFHLFIHTPYGRPNYDANAMHSLCTLGSMIYLIVVGSVLGNMLYSAKGNLILTIIWIILFRV